MSWSVRLKLAVGLGATALLLVAGDSSHALGPSSVATAPQPAEENTITRLQVHRDSKGRWIATFEYFYTGEPPAAQLGIKLLRDGGAIEPTLGSHDGYKLAQRGAHQVSIEITRPAAPTAIVTSWVMAQLQSGNQTVASQQIAQIIKWPDWQTWFNEREFADKTSDEILARAVGMIDRGDEHLLDEAKRQLERLIGRDPQFDPGYVELARVAMKSNWGPEGLRQAENLLGSALQIRPDNVNAKILLGYVYTHQARHQKAEALFADASRTDTRNLWLWANWGELLTMQGKFEPAIQKYREALTRPRTHDSYDRARLAAYARLLTLLERRKDIDGMEALQKQRAEEFGPGSCYSADYARFMLKQRGDAIAAISLAREALEGSCSSAIAREALGLAYYAAWARATGSERTKSLNQARVFLPAGPRLLYLLASSERTVGAAEQLIAAGEQIGQHDNYKFDALAHALQDKDYPAARRLIRLGARLDAAIGEGDLPVALLPVINRDFDGIRLMQEFGIDYSKLRYQGITAIEHAKRIGDRQMIEVLDPQARAL